MTCPPHHWLVTDPVGGIQQGKCKKCKARREFEPEELSLQYKDGVFGRRPLNSRRSPEFVMPERNTTYVYPPTKKEKKR